MLKSALIYLPGTLLPRLSGLLMVYLGSKLLPVEAFGYFSLITIIGEFCDTAFANWTRIAITRFGASSKGVSRDFIVRILKLSALCLAVALATGIVAAFFFTSANQSLVAGAVAFYILSIWTVRVGLTLTQLANKPKFASALESARSLLSLTIAVLCMVTTKNFLYVSLASSLINLCVGTIAVRAGFSYTDKDLDDFSDWRIIYMFGARLLLISLLSQALYTADRFVLTSLQGAAVLGLYSVAFTISRSGFDVLANSFNIGGFIRLSTLHNENKFDEVATHVWNQACLIIAMSLPLASSIILYRNVFAKLFFPEPYWMAFSIAAPFVAVGAIALNLKNFVFDNVFHLHGKNLQQVPPLIIGSVISATVAFIAIPINPMLGASLTYMSSGLSALLVTALISQRIVRVKFDFKILLTLAMAPVIFSSVTYIATCTVTSSYIVILLCGAFAALLATATNIVIVNNKFSNRRGPIAIAFISPEPEKLTGLSSYTNSLLKALAENSGANILLYTNCTAETIPSLDNVLITRVTADFVPFPHKLRLLFLHMRASLYAYKAGSSSYISTTPLGSLIPLVPQFVTIHDCYDIDMELRPLRTVITSYVLWWFLAMVSKGAICVSYATASELSRRMPGFPTRKTVIHEASKFETAFYAPKEFSGDFAYIANITINKNIDCLLAALKEGERLGYDFKVLWVGRDPHGSILQFDNAFGLPRGFIAKGMLSDTELHELIKGTDALIVTSIKEGFCLPILECQSLGRPVIASDLPVLREVAGNGAIYFDPSSPDSLLQRLVEFASAECDRVELADAATNNSLCFSWAKAARETIELTKN